MPNCNAPLTCANCKCTLAITGMRAHAPAWKKRATGSTRKARTRHRRMRLPLSQINVHLCAEKVSVTGSMTSVRLTESVTQGRGQRTPRTPLPPDLRCSLPFRCHEACGTRFSVVAYMIIRPSSSVTDRLLLPRISNANFFSSSKHRFTRWVVVTEQSCFRSSNFPRRSRLLGLLMLRRNDRWMSCRDITRRDYWNAICWQH